MLILLSVSLYVGVHFVIFYFLFVDLISHIYEAIFSESLIDSWFYPHILNLRLPMACFTSTIYAYYALSAVMMWEGTSKLRKWKLFGYPSVSAGFFPAFCPKGLPLLPISQEDNVVYCLV